MPHILSAAMRPCLLAGPARDISVSSPLIKLFTCTASPTAYISGSEVSICSSVTMLPFTPSLRPAFAASPLSGSTPIASMNISADKTRPLFKLISSDFSCSRISSTVSLRRRFIFSLLSLLCINAAKSGSNCFIS